MTTSSTPLAPGCASRWLFPCCGACTTPRPSDVTAPESAHS